MIFLIVFVAMLVWLALCWAGWWVCHEIKGEWRQWMQAQGETAQKVTRAGDFVNRNAYLIRRALIIAWVIGMLVMVGSTYNGYHPH